MAKTPEIALPEKNRKTFPGGPPGGQKSAHFFGYLITLPVGTEFCFFGIFGQNRAPPGTPPFGAYSGGLRSGGITHPPEGQCL